MKKFIYFVIICFSIFYINCKNNKNIDNLKQTYQEQTNDTFKVKIFLEINTKNLTTGDSINFLYRVSAKQKVDSIVLFFRGKRISRLDTNGNYTISVGDRVGVYPLELKVYSNGKYKTKYKKLLIRSDYKPREYTYKVLKIYPHSTDAYTQGLVYDNGILYESTGLETKSSIRKVDLKTGEVLYSYQTPENIFGEGIAIIGSYIYQITWQNHTAYVYLKENFEPVSQYTYNTEGWGLTTDGKVLYMSDGTNIIYVRDPHTFSVLRQIQVCDNRGPVKLLNELEYINGKIWANVYTKDFIVIIDPNTGKVDARIDCSGILSKKYRSANTDVLNGIAYDSVNNRIFITGKNWSKLFQIDTVLKNY